MKVAYIYRSKFQNRFSVERMFEAIEPIISNHSEVLSFSLPKFRITIKNLIENLVYVKNTVKNNKDVDIFHLTGDVYYAVLALPRNKTVLTILDTVNLKNSRGLKYFIIKLLWFSLPIKHCKYIQVISEKTKQELLEIFPKIGNKLRIIPCTADDVFVPVEKSFNKECPIILHIGTKENKNLIRVIEAVHGLNCRLKIVGELNKEQKECLNKYNVSYENTYNVSNHDIVRFYQECDIVIFPSLYEGFGSVPIEAQASARPVITSNIEPMLSVSNGASCLVDPYNVNSIREGILKVINDDKYREELVKKGLNNCKRFYPKNVAKQYITLYEEIIENNKRRND